MKRAPAHLRGAASRHQGKLVHLPRVGEDDADCRRCDDSGVVAMSAENWKICECRAGAVVLDQRAAREARG